MQVGARLLVEMQKLRRSAAKSPGIRSKTNQSQFMQSTTSTPPPQNCPVLAGRGKIVKRGEKNKYIFLELLTQHSSLGGVLVCSKPLLPPALVLFQQTLERGLDIVLKIRLPSRDRYC